MVLAALEGHNVDVGTTRANVLGVEANVLGVELVTVIVTDIANGRRAALDVSPRSTGTADLRTGREALTTGGALAREASSHGGAHQNNLGCVSNPWTSSRAWRVPRSQVRAG